MSRLAVAALLGALSAGCHSTELFEDPSEPGAFPEKHAPIAIPPDGIAILTDNGSDQLSVLDLAENTVVAQPNIGVDPVAPNGPHELAIDEAGGFVYALLTFPPPVASPGPHAAHGLSTRPGVLLKLDLRDLSRVAELTVDVNPGDVMLSPDGKRVFVAHFDLKKAIDGELKGLPVDQLRATLMIVDAASMQPVVDVPVCVAPHEIEVAPDGKTVYLACYGEDAVGVVHLDDPLLVTDPAHAVERFPVGPNPGSPASPSYGPYSISVADGKIFLADAVSKSFDVLDLVTRQRVQHITLPGTPFAPGEAPTANQWFVPTQSPDQLVVVDAASGTIVSTHPFADGSCLKPHQIEALGAREFLTCEGDHKTPSVVLELDPVSLATVRSFHVGVYPDIIAFAGGKP